MFQNLLRLNLTPDSNKTTITILGNTGIMEPFALRSVCVGAVFMVS